MRIKHFLWLFCIWGMASGSFAQTWRNANTADPQDNQSFFRDLELPAPNSYRNGSGHPGPDYWQQKVDYKIQVALDTLNHVLSGTERMTYTNNAPTTLEYIWVQLDQNADSRVHSRTYRAKAAIAQDTLPANVLANPMARGFLGIDPPFEGGYTISRVQVVDNRGGLVDAKYWINGTVMRIDLLRPIARGQSAQVEIDWSYKIPMSGEGNNGRGAREKVSDGWIYEIAQWFPRASVYDDVNGWQTDQFLGQGEFYLEFGDYEVDITVPYNHILDATGELQNPEQVLTQTQRNRLEQAYQQNEPMFIVTREEVGRPESRPTQSGFLTWKFKAKNVRDFAFASSKTYVWDAAGYRYNPTDKPIQLHSMYPRDAMPLWNKVSTRSIWQTLESYGRMSIPYPYPKASNMNGSVGGMEYPMIAFCGGRPDKEGNYTEAQERGLISVTIHEVGHNWFPMIIASDERKWTWQDEGVNTFVQYYAEQDYAKRWQNTPVGTQFKDGTYPSRRGPAKLIVPYMKQPDQMPIMTHSDAIIRNTFGNNGYSKPATGLFMLREQIAGPAAFDDAFREYSRKWAFKKPQPADFFRALDDGLGENLSWFWRGWFYTTLSNDQAITQVKELDASRLAGNYDQGQYYYKVKIENKGGLLLPIDLEATYEDGTKQVWRIPVEAWRLNEVAFEKGLFSDRKITGFKLDPNEIWADIDTSNNGWGTSAVTPPTPPSPTPTPTPPSVTPPQVQPPQTPNPNPTPSETPRRRNRNGRNG